MQSFWLSLSSDIKQKTYQTSILTLQDIETSLVDMLKRNTDSVVTITMSKDIKIYIDDPTQLHGPWSIEHRTSLLWWGSGIIVSKKWYIITNKHVVQDLTTKYSVVLYNWTSYHVDKIWLDEVLDIALLKIVDSEWNTPNSLVPASILSIDTHVDVGQFTFIIGNTLWKYSHNITMGILWWKNKQFTINGNNLYIWLYQTDTQANPGNSGWPLLDINGNVLWIVTAISEWEGITFALPLSNEFIVSTLRSIERFGKIVRPLMGIQYIDITPDIIAETNIYTWIYITDVLSNLPAWEAWIQVEDIVVAINDTPIDKHTPFLYRLYTFIPWETITLTLIRDGKTLKLPVVLGWAIK